MVELLDFNGFAATNANKDAYWQDAALMATAANSHSPGSVNILLQMDKCRTRKFDKQEMTTVLRWNELQLSALDQV